MTEKLMDSVDTLLSSPVHQHDNDDVASPNINTKKFCLSVNDYFDESRVSRWISTLTKRRKVEHLNFSLDIPTTKDFEFPSCLFTCQTLTKLELKTQTILNLPKLISFPSLKILSFEDVDFVYDNLIEQIVSNCPVLEELIMCNCSIWGWEPNICISAPALKCLMITGSGGYLGDKSDLAVIKIHAPNLQSLTYANTIVKEFVLLHSFSSLADANIQFRSPSPQTSYELSLSANKLLAGLSNVKLLKLSNQTVLYLAEDSLPNLPRFNNLIHLEVITTTFHCSRQLLNLMKFVSIAPNLESLIFTEGFYRFLSHEELLLAKKLIHEGLLLHLKVVEIREFDGRKEELQVVSFFLKNARVLERMTIITSSTLPTNKKNKVRKRLAMYSKCLKTCVVNLL